MKRRRFLGVAGMVGVCMALGCETTEPSTAPTEPITREAQSRELPVHPNTMTPSVSPMLREAGPRSMILPPINCTLGGAPESPSTNSDPGPHQSIEFGVTSIKEDHGTRRYLPYIQRRCY